MKDSNSEDSEITSEVNCCLFVDLLGVRFRWNKAGRAGAEFAFRHWNSFVMETLKNISPTSIITGLVESDSMALVFNNTTDAINTGSDLFKRVFTSRVQESGPRFWVRGVITCMTHSAIIRHTLPQSDAMPHVQRVVYPDEILDAIAAEKSGFKGMRLLVEESLLTRQVKQSLCSPVGNRFVPRYLTLRLSDYPVRLSGNFLDVLWMTASHENEWSALKILMARRLARAAKNPEEFVHAAATHVVFHECGSIFAKARRREGLTTTDYNTVLSDVFSFGKMNPRKAQKRKIRDKERTHNKLLQ